MDPGEPGGLILRLTLYSADEKFVVVFFVSHTGLYMWLMLWLMLEDLEPLQQRPRYAQPMHVSTSYSYPGRIIAYNGFLG